MKESQSSPFTAGTTATAVAPRRAIDPHRADQPGGARDLDRRNLSRFSAAVPEESLVVDGRSAVSPAQMVESKLMTLLQGASLPVSHLQMRGLVRGRPGA